MAVIRMVPRTSPRFQNRAIEIYTAQEQASVPIEDGLIICDACNAEIRDEKVALLFSSSLDKWPWGAICQDCIKRSFATVTVEELLE